MAKGRPTIPAPTMALTRLEAHPKTVDLCSALSVSDAAIVFLRRVVPPGVRKNLPPFALSVVESLGRKKGDLGYDAVMLFFGWGVLVMNLCEIHREL